MATFDNRQPGSIDENESRASPSPSDTRKQYGLGVANALISVLPTEILQYILRHLTSRGPFGTEYTDGDALLIFTHVCQFWRRVALAYQMPWSFLDLSWREPRSQAWASRAGPLLLHYRFDDSGPRDWDQTTGYHELLRRLVALINAAESNTERCRSLSIYTGSRQLMTSIWWITQRPFPNLTSVEVYPKQKQQQRSTQQQQLSLKFSSTGLHNVQSLKLRSTTILRSTGFGRKLETLSLLDPPRDTSVWLSLLPRLTSLRRLSIVNGAQSGSHRIADDTPFFALPSLETLFLYDSAYDLLDLLALRGEFRNIRTVIIAQMAANLQSVTRLVSLFIILKDSSVANFPPYLASSMLLTKILTYPRRWTG